MYVNNRADAWREVASYFHPDGWTHGYKIKMQKAEENCTEYAGRRIIRDGFDEPIRGKRYGTLRVEARSPEWGRRFDVLFEARYPLDPGQRAWGADYLEGPRTERLG